MRNVILTACFLLFAASANALVTDWPHNETENISCVSCHSYSLWWQFSPVDGDIDLRKNKTAAVCLQCHTGENGAEISAETHAHSVIELIYDSGYDDWSRACVDCHDPHFQAQLGWYGDTNVTNDDLFLVQGKIGNITPNGDNTTTFTYSSIVAGSSHQIWDDNVTDWTRKSGPNKNNRKLIVALPVTEPAGADLFAFPIVSVNATSQKIKVYGDVNASEDNATFGLSYGQLIRDQIMGPAGAKDVKFFDPSGGFVDPNNNEGLCQVCHSQTSVFQYDDNASKVASDHADKFTTYDDPILGKTQQYGIASRCSFCHSHDRGFGPGADTGQHPVHLGMEGIQCNYCHTNGVPDPLTEVGCNICHNDGRGVDNSLIGNEGVDYLVDDQGNKYGMPNDLDYRNHWLDDDTAFALNCNSCHKGALLESNMNTGCFHTDNCTSPPNFVTCASGSGELCPDVTCNAPTFSWNLALGQPNQCDDCHKGKTLLCGSGACDSCHLGDGSITGLGVDIDKLEISDIQAPPVGMETNGHERLVSSRWIRQYDCFYCHTDSVDDNTTVLLSKHANLTVDVVMDEKWYITGTDNVTTPYYTGDNPGQGEEADSCYNVYCHSDGTNNNPEIHPYQWTGVHQDCNACHGHSKTAKCEDCHFPDDGNVGHIAGADCSSCHDPVESVLRSWEDYPDKKWLSAMPMYKASHGANSHWRHLFTGFSCDECHNKTVQHECLDGSGDTCSSCLDCHSDGAVLTESMTETAHINPQYHVNKTKDIYFKNGQGQFDETTKTCTSTRCHDGGDPPVWGQTKVTSNYVCKQCHGSNTADLDDFGKLNGIRAQIDENQWETTGHGRLLSSGSYPSGNPPADFGDNGCWYCHDSQVMHQVGDRPFRLVQHDHFSKRFDLECVYCHMLGEDNECLTCHNVPLDIGYTSLAPQLEIIADNVTVTNPNYASYALGVNRPDHRTYNLPQGDIDGESSCINCHIGNSTRHKTHVQDPWDVDEIEDARNAYVQMGVCLKCHDDDAGGQCTTCHGDDPATPEDETLTKYIAGFDPSDLNKNLVMDKGRITPALARASSFHFGHKHFDAYKASKTNNLITDEPVDDNETTTAALKDSNQNWATDQFIGLRVRVDFGDVNGTTETRLITGNSADTLTVAPLFSQLVSTDASYTIIDIVWKGGKFCWDCHDPHGDDNIYMIQNEVATRTDGYTGKPMERRTVRFTTKVDGKSYAKSDGDPGPVDGICNVCHDSGVGQHYTSAGGDGHNSGRVCTECHEHRFTNSHASGQTCNTCHPNKPVPRHTAFGQARDCTKCHDGTVGHRMNIMKQFKANSHHVQTTDGTVTNKHCYACHWEATKEGVINSAYHAGYNLNTYSSESGGAVDLVVWMAGKRPGENEYDDCATDGGNVTAVSFLAKDVDIWSEGTAATIASQRREIEKVTLHCLGCHSDQNNDTQPFNLVDEENGDCKTPRQYAWDRSSIAARYDDNGTTNWGKYSGPNIADKGVVKAFSAHGNALSGGGGWDSDNGTDETINNTRTGAYNIQCFDCHSSHGSNLGADFNGTITSSYVTFNGTKNGANLKETQKDVGGYTMDYMATANWDDNSVNPYQAGAGQCFDCHETANSNTAVGAGATTPWGFAEIFGAAAPVIGYQDNPRFKGDYSGGRYGYRSGMATVGGHLHASSSLTNPVMGTIDGLCTPCHDPHGLSPTLGADKEFAVPLLKGTWMTSPYKEDAPPASESDGYSGSSGFRNHSNAWFTSSTWPRPYPNKADPQPSGVWRTDRNTFNQLDRSVKANSMSTDPAYDRVLEPAEKFAGLCLRCHPKASLTSDVTDNATEDVSWGSTFRIHRSVQGWGWQDGDTPREHSYTCSKCHQPHASGLPRLMKTNCLDYKHRGEVISGGIAASNNLGYQHYYAGRFPYGWWDNGLFYKESYNMCHGADTANGPDNWPDNQQWNSVTPWGGQ